MNTASSRALLVRDFMSKDVLTVYSHSKVDKAIRIMAGHNVGSVVVLDSSGPLGVFTERDLLRVLARRGSVEGTVVMEAMSPMLASVGEEDGLDEAARLMTGKKSRLIVFGHEGLGGIVTATDVVRAIHSLGAQFAIESAVTRNVFSVDADTPIGYVTRDMDQKRIGSVIVSLDDKPFAIFTERDLLRKVLAKGLPLTSKIVDVSSSPLVTAQSGIGGREVASFMVTDHIKRLPVFLGDRMVGILTARDLVEAFTHRSS